MYIEGSEDVLAKLDEVISIASKYFTVIDYYISDNTVTIRVICEDIKRRFLDFYNEIKRLEIVPFLDKVDDYFEIKIAKYIPREKSDVKKPIALLLATIGTVTMDGWMRSVNPYLYYAVPGYNPVFMTILFTVALLGIIGIHELGHKLALHIYGIKASWPYFIPGIPGVFPTFGAVITQEEIPPNRDRLFDMGVSGPIAGFITTVIVSAYAVLTAPVVSIDTLKQWHAKIGGEIMPFPVPILYSLLQDILRPLKEGYVVLVDPITWAAVVGMLITALNIFPAWQLDGGHLARAVLGPKYHKYSTLISIFILFLVGYYFMALFIWFMYIMSRGVTIRPLDDVSSVSLSRKIIFIISWILAFLCLPLPSFSL